MGLWKRKMWILWVGVVLCSSSYTMSVPFLPLYLSDLGVSGDAVHLWSGVVLSASFLVGAVMGPLWGGLADRFGKRKMVIRAGIGLAVVYVLFAIVHNPWELLAARLLHGFVAGFIPASMALVASITPEKEMGWSLGTMQAGTMSGGILGPLFGGVLANAFGMRLSFAVAAGIVFLATVAVFFFVKEDKTGVQENAVKPRPQIAQPQSAAQPGRKIPLNRTLLYMLGLLFLYQLCLSSLQPILPLHISELQGGSGSAILTSGIVISMVGIAGIIASPLWGRFGGSIQPGSILQICYFGASLIVILQVIVPSIWLFTVVQFGYGLFMAGIVPTVNTIIMKHTSVHSRGKSFGMTSSANQLGGMIGPIAGGSVGLWLGNQWMFAVVGAMLIVTGVAVRWMGAERPKRAALMQRSEEVKL